MRGGRQGEEGCMSVYACVCVCGGGCLCARVHINVYIPNVYKFIRLECAHVRYEFLYMCVIHTYILKAYT